MVDESSPSSSSGQHVFVSYSRADRQRVVGVATLLEALGHRVFMDERSILAGERWKARLMDEVRRSDVLVVFWTRNAARLHRHWNFWPNIASTHPRWLKPVTI